MAASWEKLISRLKKLAMFNESTIKKLDFELKLKY